jgi:hypothetical protein
VVFHIGNTLLLSIFRGYARGLKEHSGPPIKLQVRRVNLGHLEDRDADAYREEGQDKGENLRYRGTEPLEEDL